MIHDDEDNYEEGEEETDLKGNSKAKQMTDTESTHSLL